MNTRSLGIACVFVAGCAVGGASARFVVPAASAQAAMVPPPNVPRWEYMCAELPSLHAEELTGPANVLGAQYWEFAGFVTAKNFGWCFKRPKL